MAAPEGSATTAPTQVKGLPGFFLGTGAVAGHKDTASSTFTVEINGKVTHEAAEVDEDAITAFQSAQRGALMESGITHIVNCAGDMYKKAPFPSDFKYHIIDLVDDPTGRSLAAREDPSSIDVASKIGPMTEFLDEAVGSGGKVLVHCHRGFSRSPGMLVAYTMRSIAGKGPASLAAALKDGREEASENGQALYKAALKVVRESHPDARPRFKRELMRYGNSLLGKELDEGLPKDGIVDDAAVVSAGLGGGGGEGEGKEAEESKSEGKEAEESKA